MADRQGGEQKEADLLCSDALVNFRTVQSFGNEEVMVKKYAELLEEPYQTSRKALIQAALAFGFSQFSTFAVLALMFWAGGRIVGDSYNEETQQFEINPENVFIALFALMFGASHAGTAAAFGPDTGKALAAATTVFRIIDEPSVIDAVAIDKDESKKHISTKEVQGKIEFKDVWFRYPTRKEDFVLRGLSIVINPSETVALVGESGCGKSTFVNLLMRFYDVDFGEILLDDVNIKDYNLHDLRRAVSLVMQEPVVFNYSILENILYSKLDATNSEIANAATIANAMEFIQANALKSYDDSAQSLAAAMEANKASLIDLVGAEKYQEEMDVLKKLEDQEKKSGEFAAVKGDIDTRDESLTDVKLAAGFEIACGTRGSKLSGGQKQRVAIARTVIRSPKVLMLDEATSALDEDSQKLVQQALENVMEGRTTIVIAHRMSTIQRCEKIFVLEHGKVLEEGNFNALKEKGGLFSKLAEGQGARNDDA